MLLAVVLSACTTATPIPVPPAPQPVQIQAVCPPPRENPQPTGILAYYSRINALSASDAVAEYNAVNASFLAKPDNILRTKLAMLLSLPDTPFHNTTAARDLLLAWTGQTADQDATGLHDLATLLVSLLSQQVQADNTAKDLSKALASEKMHSKSLQGKIDAIKAYETSRRNQP